MEERKVFNVIGNKETEIEFSEIKKNMKIKLYEPDGAPIKYKNNNILVATSDAYENENEILTFNVEV